MKDSILLPALFASIAALAGGVAMAQPPQGRPHGPPPEAFSACESQDEGSLCAFESRHGALEGTCRAPRGDRLVCVPDDAPPHPPCDHEE